MSIFSRLKSVFGGAAAPRAEPTAQAATSAVPKVSKPVAPQPTPATDQRSVRLNRQVDKIAPGIACDDFDGSSSLITAVPDDLVVRYRLKLVGCKKLTDLPTGLSVPSLDLSGCTALQRLPSGMNVTFLTLSGCQAIRELPEDLRIAGGILNLSRCTGLTSLPDNLGEVAGLNLNGCSNITGLPAGLIVTSWIDITGTKITEIPEAYSGVGLRRGIDVISSEEALAS